MGSTGDPPSSHLMPSQARSLSTASSDSFEDRAWSVSSILHTHHGIAGGCSGEVRMTWHGMAQCGTGVEAAPEHHLAACVAGIQPIEQGCPCSSDMQVAGRGGREAHPHLQGSTVVSVPWSSAANCWHHSMDGISPDCPVASPAALLLVSQLQPLRRHADALYTAKAPVHSPNLGEIRTSECALRHVLISKVVGVQCCRGGLVELVRWTPSTCTRQADISGAAGSL